MTTINNTINNTEQTTNATEQTTTTPPPIEQYYLYLFLGGVNFDLTALELRAHMEQFYGEVDRIDFANFKCMNGRGRNAFVHMKSFYNDNQRVIDLQDKIKNDDYFNDGVFIFGKNKNPVPKTELNIEQIASNTQLIGEKQEEIQDYVLKQDQTIIALQNKIQFLEMKFLQLENITISLMSNSINNNHNNHKAFLYAPLPPPPLPLLPLHNKL